MEVNDNLTEIIAVLDRSGSMSGDEANVIEGFNAFVEGQKKEPGECRLTLYGFDSESRLMIGHVSSTPVIERLLENVPIAEVPPLDNSMYFARGGTPLNDAIAQAIDEAGARYSSLPENERPGKIIVFISTDGGENSSKEFPGVGNQAIKDKINHQESKYSWQFIFTAADIDAYEINKGLEIQTSGVLNFAKGSDGVNAMYSALNNKVSSYRSGTVRSMAFSEAEKNEVEKHIKTGDTVRSSDSLSTI